jgi:hypothetical protein
MQLIGDQSIAGEYEAAIGNFGKPDYGGRLRGMVVYPDVNRDACDAFAGGEHTFSPTRGTPQIVLLDRGSKFAC